PAAPAAGAAPSRAPSSPPSPSPAAAAGAGEAAAWAPDLDLDLDLEIDLDLDSELVVDEAAGPPPARGQGPPSRPLPGGSEVGEEDQGPPGGRFGLGAGYEPAFEVEEETASGAAGQAGAAAGPAGARGPRPAPVPVDGGDDLEDVFVLDIEDEEE